MEAVEPHLHASKGTDNKSVDKACQTDHTTELSQLFKIEMFKNQSKLVQFYTGFQNYEHFMYAYHCLGPAAEHLNYQMKTLDPKNEFFLCIMKLRLDREDEDLGVLFGVSCKVVGHVFSTCLAFMSYQFKELNLFVSSDVVKEHMPEDFGQKFP